jgi:transposase
MAKHRHIVLILDDTGKVMQSALDIENNRRGLDDLLARLKALPGPVTVGLEATGHYWLALYDELTQQDYAVTVLNPLQVAACRRSGLRKFKTDPSDAFWIADFMRIANLPPTSQDTPVISQLRELTRFRFRLVQQIADCKRKILSVLECVFPEYEALFSSVFMKSSRALLPAAATADEIANFDLAELAHLLQRTSRGRFGRQKAEAIIQRYRAPPLWGRPRGPMHRNLSDLKPDSLHPAGCLSSEQGPESPGLLGCW